MTGIFWFFYTEPLTTASDAATIQAKLMDLPFLHDTESFQVAVASPVAPDVGVVLTITFISSRGMLYHEMLSYNNTIYKCINEENYLEAYLITKYCALYYFG